MGRGLNQGAAGLLSSRRRRRLVVPWVSQTRWARPVDTEELLEALNSNLDLRVTCAQNADYRHLCFRVLSDAAATPNGAIIVAPREHHEAWMEVSIRAGLLDAENAVEFGIEQRASLLIVDQPGFEADPDTRKAMAGIAARCQRTITLVKSSSEAGPRSSADALPADEHLIYGVK